MPTKQQPPTTQNTGVPLTELASVRQRFLRSVNLERDFYSPDPLAGYVPTPAAFAALERIAEGIGNPSARAYSLTGAYGTGKSAFALFAAKTLAVGIIGDSALREQARQTSPLLDTMLFDQDAAGLWPVLVTGAREPLSHALVRGLIQSLDNLPDAAKQAAIQAIRETRNDAGPSGRTGRKGHGPPV